MMIVQIESWTPAHWNDELSATPVMMPGSAIGRTSSSEIESRPKNLARWTPNAAIEPSTNAMAVAAKAAFNDKAKAARTAGSFQATLYHEVVQLRIGHVSTFDLSNPNSTMVAMGAKRNTMTPSTHSHIPARATRALTAPRMRRDAWRR